MSAVLRVLRGGLLVALVLLGAVASALPELIRVDTPLSVVLLVLDVRVLIGVLGAAFLLALLLYLLALRSEDPNARVETGPTVEALVPAYRDAEVVHRSVEGLASTPYEDLTVTVVCEPGDDETQSRARDLAAAFENVRVLVNEERSGTKAGALNLGIARSDADVIGIFDADQTPHPDLVPHAVAALEGADVASVKSVPNPAGGLLESEGYYEFLTLYFLPQQLVKRLTGLAFVGSQSVFLWREVFERVGTYDEETLTEDMEFTHRCNQAGLSIRELNYYPCFEEPVHTLRDWWGQRVRWMTGHLEVGARQVRTWRSRPARETLASLGTLAGTFVAGVALSMTVPKLLLSALAHPVTILAGLSAFYGVILATRAVDNRTADTTGFGIAWLLLPVFFTLYGLVIVSVLLTTAVGGDREWYHVTKGT